MQKIYHSNPNNMPLHIRTFCFLFTLECVNCKLMHNTFLPCSIVTSFVELTRIVLDIPGVKYFLSEKLCQDPLESFFGKQRMRGGYSENPSVNTFLKGTVSLRVQGSVAVAPKRGNCTRREESNDLVDDAPLPKRRRRNK